MSLRIALKLTVLAGSALLGTARRTMAQATATAISVALPQAAPNDQRRPAGRVVNGERRIELDIVRTTRLSSVPKAPPDRSMAFAAATGQAAWIVPEPLLLAPGEAHEVTFTPSTAVTSFYFASLAQNATLPLPPDPEGDRHDAPIGGCLHRVLGQAGRGVW